jgi:four helix bundle protein
MPTIKRFEDIDAWRSGRLLVKELYRVTGDGLFARDYDLRNQLRRAGVSILSNIAEGFERSGNKEFRRFLFIAKGSAGEVRSLLYVAADSGYISTKQHEDLFAQTVLVSNQIAGFIRYLDAHPDLPRNGARALHEDGPAAYDAEPSNLQTFKPSTPESPTEEAYL